MAILIGTDEAGYGPNLGPLVICATAWDVQGDRDDCDLYDRLSAVVSPGAGNQHIPIADSKQLFKQGGSLANLELGVHAGLSILGLPVRCWREMFTLVDAAAEQHLALAPWYRDYDETLPLDVTPQKLEQHAEKLQAALATAGISLIAIRAAIVFPSPFNQRVETLGSKGALLTEHTLGLVRDILNLCPAGQATVLCDKHGGRNRYASALQHTWPDSWIEICEEGRRNSTYQLPINDRQTRISFTVGGESQLPAALASMTAKYLRELAMRAFNAFWQQELPQLRPTAGYPVDAKRFKADIAATQRRLQIDDNLLWRCK